MKGVVLFLAFIGLAVPWAAALANPILIDPVYAAMAYQGTVYDEEYNVPVTGEHDLIIKIYSEYIGGSLLHDEEFPDTPVVSGFFQVVIGTNTTLDIEIFDGRELWVETEFEGTVFERQVIRPVAHALTANNATFASNLNYIVATDPEWKDIDPGEAVSVYHNLGGTSSYYTVILDGKASNGTIHQANLGTARAAGGWIGCEWYNLNSTRVYVERGAYDASTGNTKDWDKFRIRLLRNQPITYVPPPLCE